MKAGGHRPLWGLQAAVGTLIGNGAILLQRGGVGGAFVADSDVVSARDDDASFYEVLQRGDAPGACFPGCGRPASPSAPPSPPAARRARGVCPLKNVTGISLAAKQCEST